MFFMLVNFLTTLKRVEIGEIIIGDHSFVCYIFFGLNNKSSGAYSGRNSDPCLALFIVYACKNAYVKVDYSMKNNSSLLYFLRLIFYLLKGKNIFLI